MSRSRCMSCAFDAVRPTKRINLQTRPLLQTRHYADAASESPQANLRHLGSLQQGAAANPLPRRSSPRSQLASIPDAPPKRAPLESTTTPATPSEASAAESAAYSSSGKLSKPIPANVLATYRTPLKHHARHKNPVAQLQLRSYSVRNLEFFADFAMRVAQYLKLPATGPKPLPKRTERWTTIRSNFVHKKSQENFERITMSREIMIYDGHKDVVEIWLACLRKWQFYGVGMKANVWESEGLDVASKMDKERIEVEEELDKKLANFGWNNSVAKQKSIQDMLRRQGANVPGSAMTELRDEIKGAKNMDLFRDVR